MTDDDKEFYEEGASLAAKYEASVRKGDSSTYFDSDEMERHRHTVRQCTPKAVP